MVQFVRRGNVNCIGEVAFLCYNHNALLSGVPMHTTFPRQERQPRRRHFDLKEIVLRNGEKALVDDEDFEWLSQWNWNKNQYGYAMRSTMKNGKSKNLFMHQLIMECPKGMEIDHANRNKLDNRRSNLRVATRQQNSRNMPATHKSKTSIYKGVSWYSRDQRWIAQISTGEKCLKLGRYESEEDAAKAYDQAAYKEFGEFAYLNFPNTDPTSHHPKKYVPQTSSRYRGVSWYSPNGKWRATVKVNGKVISLGYHRFEWEAAQAYNRYVTENNLSRHTLNFIDDYS